MLCVPTPRLAVVHVAVLLLPLPASATAVQLGVVIGLPSALKATLPVGLLPLMPLTVAVNVTLVPTTAGFAELVSVVVVAGKVGPAVPQASISMMREYEGRELVTLTR